MTDPQESLSLLAEIAVAIAGFSGIVIAYSERALSAVSTLEKRRLTNLFILSGLVLFISLFEIALLHLDLADQSILWRGGSATIFLLITPWLIFDALKVMRLEAADKRKVSWLVFYCFDSVAIAVLVLQVYNFFWLRQEWPFFLGMVVATAGAFQQFVLIVNTKLRES